MHETLQMMNLSDGDVNLGLAMGSANYSIQTGLIDSSGAGVNADSRTDLAFAASDPLSELVWSPHNGLSLKRANSSAADKKPFRLWNVGPSNKGPSPSEIIIPKGSRDDNAVDQGNSTMSQTMLDADDIFVDKATLLKCLESCEGLESNMKMEEEARTKDAIQMEDNRTDERKKVLCCPQNVQSAGIAEMSQENTDLQPQKDPDDKLTSATGAGNKNKRNMPISNPAPLLKKLESAAEKGLCNLTEKDACSLGGNKLPRENSPPVEGSETNSRTCLYKDKGKEKALSDGDIYGRSLDDEDDIHESVESCNGAGLFPKGIKRQSYDEGLILGSKKMKKQVHGRLGSTSITKPDGSFLNSISNMVKGFSDSNKEDSSSLALPLACSNNVNGKNHHENFMCNRAQDSASLNMGFETIFQSLYCKDMNVLNMGVQKENDSTAESGELVVGDRKSLKNLPGDTNYGSSCKQIILRDIEVNPLSVGRPSKPCILSADIDCSPYLCGSNLVENEAFENLVSNREKDGVIPSDSLDEQMNNAAEITSPEIPVATSDVPGKSNLLSSLWFTRLCTKNPRSEKCQEIIQETIETSTTCPKVDLDSQMNAVVPIDQKSSEARDDSADSQVYAPMKESQKFTANNEVSFDLMSKNKLCPILPAQIFRSSEAMASVFARRLDALRHILPSENDLKDNQKLPLCDIVSAQNTVPLSEIFHAVRNLHLSRADILRWMNSNVPLSHLNGFFLRLRLGKLETGLEGTSYHVACITGDGRELNVCTSKKSILVDVGGIKSSVSSQYVSNHDFLEDEIKSWWCRIVDSGCRVPSLDELNSKFNDRKSLGL